MSVVIAGACAVAVTTILKAPVPVPAAFVALTVKLNVPAVVGVPEITPALLKFKPLGRLPLSIDQVGAVPVALNVAL